MLYKSYKRTRITCSPAQFIQSDLCSFSLSPKFFCVLHILINKKIQLQRDLAFIYHICMVMGSVYCVELARNRLGWSTIQAYTGLNKPLLNSFHHLSMRETVSGVDFKHILSRQCCVTTKNKNSCTIKVVPRKLCIEIQYIYIYI